ncbi:membrane protein [Clostridium carboxidivorans P7]|uniref:Dicarboxylate carrier MatC domain protein n=1 Tax=Clostridium carboxidivorans P7 TaxID=536227 RepID=C6PWR6_9CLOT|nr:SLC13 family permease [Clostridium carboxidivorans]AKN32001.1 membrane protein [Clostridium carboxidivorans P7]EET86291.1 Dicarboxylate carrier MatC domain protein [Clostridium carboxidivorans P7]EFG87863.1 Gram-positive signal peptide, YSIRK family [Clostridium carboxidivorans P7]
MNNGALLSLAFLVLAIVLGFVKKMNVGIVAIALAMVVGKLVGLSDTKIIAGFSSSLFVMLAGITFLFSIVQVNGTLELIAKKAVALAGKRTKLIPAVVYLVGFLIAAAGPGAVPAIPIVVMFSAPLAIILKISPIMLSAIGVIGTLAGRMTAITPEGILITSITSKQGITNVMTPALINATISTIILAILVYVYYKGYKTEGENPLKLSELPKFTKNQVITIIGVIIMIFSVTVLKYNVGLTSFLIAAVLLALKVADEKECIKAVPWGILLLVTGAGVLMNIVIVTGGIDLLAKTLAKFMTPTTSSFIMAITSGAMTWFSSTLGVVIPTLVPTVGTIAHTVGGGVSGTELTSAIVIASSVAGALSPGSTGGAMILAAYVANTDCSEAEQSKLFVELFIWSVVGMVLIALIALLGGYRVIG